MALCDELAADRSSGKARRDRLMTASLQRLNSSVDASEFRKHAAFHLHRFARFTTRPEHIPALRQTLLNFAVSGKLAPQDLDDEPASILLQRLIEDTKVYAHEQNLNLPPPKPIDEETVPHPAPPGWIWTRLCSLFKVITDGDHQPPPKSENGVAFLTIGNITTGRLDFSNSRFVPEDYFESLAKYRRPQYGDILYTVVGATYGRPAVVDTHRKFCVQRHIAILKPTSEVDVNFLCTLLASPLVYEQATRSITGTAQPTIPIRLLRNFLVLLPPLAEQRRIADKVVKLLALCDQIEIQLTTSLTENRRFLEAAISKVLGISSGQPIEQKLTRIQRRTKQQDAIDSTPAVKQIPSRTELKFSTYNQIKTIDDMVECLTLLGGATTPERLLSETRLASNIENIEKFFDLLREGRNSRF